MTERPGKSRVLLGFMAEAEALSFLKGNCIFDGTTDEKLREIVKNSNAAVESLPSPQLDAEVLEIESRFQRHLDSIVKNPVFPEAVGQRKWSFKLIEIDKLVCFQTYVDAEYSEEMGEKQDFSDLKSMIEFCLPTKPMKRQVAASFDPIERAHTLVSPTMDFRVIGPVRGMDPVTKRQSFGFLIGWGVPFVLVVKFQDRYFLKNGYHRVYMLAKNGIKHAACILIDGENYEDTGAARPGFFSQTLALSDKPPVFANFLSEKIAPEIRMLPQTKIIRVKVDEFALPLSSRLRKASKGVVPVLRAEAVEASIPTAIEDFSIQKEDWNVYPLSDGTILKLRQLLVKVRSEPTETTGESAMQMDLSSLLMATFAPKELKGPPSSRQYSLEELASSIATRDIHYVPIREVTNEYATTSGVKLSLQLTSISVAKTDKIDATGEPIYIVNAQVGVQIAGPPTGS